MISPELHLILQAADVTVIRCIHFLSHCLTVKWKCCNELHYIDIMVRGNVELFIRPYMWDMCEFLVNINDFLLELSAPKPILTNSLLEYSLTDVIGLRNLPRPPYHSSIIFAPSGRSFNADLVMYSARTVKSKRNRRYLCRIVIDCLCVCARQ